MKFQKTMNTLKMRNFTTFISKSIEKYDDWAIFLEIVAGFFELYKKNPWNGMENWNFREKLHILTNFQWEQFLFLDIRQVIINQTISNL